MPDTPQDRNYLWGVLHLHLLLITGRMVFYPTTVILCMKIMGVVRDKYDLYQLNPVLIRMAD